MPYNKAEIESNLAQYYCTEKYHRFSILSKLVMTDGVKYLANACQCFWLMDIIASYQSKAMKDPRLAEIQFWELKKDGKGFKVTCSRDTNDVAITQRIPYSDFPLDSVKIWVENGVVMLPSER